MRINERLNLVIPLYQDDQAYAYVHSIPLSREVFEANYMLIAKTFTSIHAEGLGEIAGPRVAAHVLRDLAAQANKQASASSLFNEIRRLSNVIMAGPGGESWSMVPLQEAMDRKLLDADDLVEVENALVFFTVVSPMYPRNLRQQFLDGAANLWGAQIISPDCMAFKNSLPISTATASSGAMAITSSRPS